MLLRVTYISDVDGPCVSDAGNPAGDCRVVDTADGRYSALGSGPLGVWGEWYGSLEEALASNAQREEDE